jgi:hypothetical protein
VVAVTAPRQPEVVSGAPEPGALVAPDALAVPVALRAGADALDGDAFAVAFRADGADAFVAVAFDAPDLAVDLAVDLAADREDGAFFAEALPADVFLAAGLLVDDLAVEDAFLAEDFAEDVAFFAEDVDFFAVDFLAVDFLAVDFDEPDAFVAFFADDLAVEDAFLADDFSAAVRPEDDEADRAVGRELTSVDVASRAPKATATCWARRVMSSLVARPNCSIWSRKASACSWSSVRQASTIRWRLRLDRSIKSSTASWAVPAWASVALASSRMSSSARA